MCLAIGDTEELFAKWINDSECYGVNCVSLKNLYVEILTPRTSENDLGNSTVAGVIR